MVNLVFLYGEDPKPGIDKLIKHLPSDWNIHVLKFFDGEIDFGRKVTQVNVFSDPIFKTHLSKEQIKEAENFIEHSFFLALQYNYFWFKGHNTDPKTLEKFYEIMAKMVFFFKNYFESNKIDFYSTYVACRLPFIVSILTAKKMKLLPLNFAQTGTSQTIFLRDFDFAPIFYKKTTSKDVSAAKEFFQKRYMAKKVKQENTDVMNENKKKFGFLNFASDNFLRFKSRVFGDKSHPHKLVYKPLIPIVLDRLTKQARRFIVPIFIDKLLQNEKFLFFPLHHDEETHLSWGEHFSNQYEIMEKVSRSLPEGIYLYIKPHPSWFCTDFPVSQVLKLKKLRNVRIVNPKISPIELIKNSLATVTINSTTGLEAIIFGKPVLTFGHNFYAKEGLSVVVHDMHTLPKAIEKIIFHPELSFDQNERDEFLGTYYSHLIHISVPLVYELDFSMEDARKMADAMLDLSQFLSKNQSK